MGISGRKLKDNYELTTSPSQPTLTTGSKSIAEPHVEDRWAEYITWGAEVDVVALGAGWADDGGPGTWP
jgi:hypothetical protein